MLTGGELAISDSLAINGPTNATLIITGDGLGRVFDITTPGQTVQLNNLLITGGVATEGGGILNSGSALTLKNDVLEFNEAVATTPGGNALGGAVASTGSGASLTINGTSAVLSNTATGARRRRQWGHCRRRLWRGAVHRLGHLGNHLRRYRGRLQPGARR